MRVDWCVSSWFRIKNTHTHSHWVCTINNEGALKENTLAMAGFKNSLNSFAVVPVRASPVPSEREREREFLIRNHDDTHQSTRIGCLHERRSYSRAHTTPGSNVDTPIAGDTTRSRMASQKFCLWAPKGISSSVVTHAPSHPGRMRLTSRQSISPWRVARRVFRHAASSKPPADWRFHTSHTLLTGR